jgi:arginine deiminase
MPNLYFTRDIGAVIGSGIAISRMKTEARKRETLFLKYVYDNHPIFKDTCTPAWYNRDMAYSLEGGDELVLGDEVIAIGCSERTSPEGIELEAKNIFRQSGIKKVIVFDSISSTWALYEYDKDFACSMVYDNRLYYSADYLYHMDYPYDPYGPTYDGLNDDGVSIAQDLKSKFFDFGKAANKKKFKELYFTIYTELISYNIGLLLNMDNEYETISEEIVNTVVIIRTEDLTFFF